MPLRVQPFAADLVHRQRSHRLRHKLRANSDQIEHSLPRTALASLRPEVLQVLPGAVDLDLKLHGDMLERGVLDTSILSNIDNPLGSLWLSTERLVEEYLARQAAGQLEPTLLQNPDTKLVLRLRIFCTQIKRKYADITRPAHLDFYVLASSSVKVGCCTCSA